MGSEQQATFDFVGTLSDRLAETSQQPPRFSIIKNCSLGRELGVPRKAAAVSGATFLTARKAGAIVRSNVSSRRSTVYLGDPTSGAMELEPVLGNPVVSGMVSGSRAMNAYWPTEITDAGVAFPQSAHAATCDDIVAAVVTDIVSATPHSLYVSYLGGPPQLVMAAWALAQTSVWITKHGTGVYRLWYMRANALRCRSLSISGGLLSWGGENTIYTPITAGVVQPAFASFGTDGNGDATYCWVLTQDAAVNTTMRLLKVNIGTFAVTASLAFVAALPSTNDFVFALSHLSIGGTNYVALAWSDAAGPGARCHVVNGDTMTTSIATFTPDAGVYGPVTVQWMAIGSWVGFVYVSCKDVATLGTSVAYTKCLFYQGPTMGGPGVLDDTVTLNWHQPLSNGCMWARSTSEIYPLFMLQANYDVFAGIADPEFVEDPSLEVYTPQLYDATNAEFTLSSIARFGVDRCVLGPALGLGVVGTQAQYLSCTQAGELRALYNGEPQATYEGVDVRYVKVDLTAGGRNVQADKGVAIIAAAQPAYWDGHESAEWGPLHKPKVFAAAAGGAGPALTGTYAYRAYVVWRDSSGESRRSAVSLPFTVVPAGTPVRVWVTMPVTCRDGVTQGEFDILVYGSKNGGPFYLLQYSTTGRMTPTSKNTIGCWFYNNVPEVAATTLLWSTGAGVQELFPVAPPPLWDAAIVGSRLWAVDAENRSRAVCTKLKQDGIAHEFADGLEVLFTAGQKLYAVNEIDGVPLFLTSLGAYLVHGDGYDNTGQGAGFGLPMRIAQPPCTQRDSVVRTPVGVFYANDERFVLLQSGGGARVFDELQVPTSAIVRTDVFEATTEVVFWTATGAAYVYNYVVDKWTTWDTSVDASEGLYVHGNQMLAFASGLGAYRIVDVEAANTALQGRWKTGWIALAGPQGPCVYREIVLLMKRLSAHSLTVTVYTDYQTDAAHTTTVSLTSGNITSALEGSYYTVRGVLVSPQARAVMIDVQEAGAAGEGCVPVACTILANVEPGIQRRYLSTANK